MKSGARASVVSSFTVIKGAMIDVTYAVLEAWDFSASKRDNLARLQDSNYIGSRSAAWLRDVGWVLNRRLDPTARDRALTILAKGHYPLEKWRPLLLWHITRDEFLLRDFLVNWLFEQWTAGAYRLNPEDVRRYLETVPSRGGVTEHAWSEATTQRVIAGLLNMATDFGLLRGSVKREFASFHLPEDGFLYVLHAMYEATPNATKIVHATDWRMFLMTPSDVERELLRLHQFRKLDYQVAGSLVQLSLPHASASEYAERMVA